MLVGVVVWLLDGGAVAVVELGDEVGEVAIKIVLLGEVPVVVVGAWLVT